ncbi:MAG: alkaline phosphatase family protein [Anaerolineales bacterium]|nr:alkaline phosphatase family protein [Anaerolineales bacterium]
MLQHKLLLIDIDGLRPDVFFAVVGAGLAPNLARLLGGQFLERGLQIPIVATAPSATFCSQASLMTGVHPNQHGIPGNQYLDRFGLNENNSPRRLGFDVGDIMAVDDGFRVFSDGLAAQRLQSETIFQKWARQDRRAIVAGHMYATGADQWLRPSYWRLGLMTKGPGKLTVPAQQLDGHTVRNLIQTIHENGVPEVTMVYFLGIDHESHGNGPAIQSSYLIRHLDPLIGDLEAAMRTQLKPGEQIITAIFSDHGQTDVPADPEFAIRIGRRQKDEMAALFTALGRQPYRHIMQRVERTDTFIAINGGLTALYLRRFEGDWNQPPQFQRNVLQLAEAFWDAHHWGTYGRKLHGAISGVLLRDVENEGWHAPFRALTEDGSLLPLTDWFSQQPAGLYLDPVNRLNNLAGPMAGDIIILSDFDSGYYFGNPHAGVHGGLHPAESRATLAIGWPEASAGDWHRAKAIIRDAIQVRCRQENGRLPSVTDMATALNALWQLHPQASSALRREIS